MGMPGEREPRPSFRLTTDQARCAFGTARSSHPLHPGQNASWNLQPQYPQERVFPPWASPLNVFQRQQDGHRLWQKMLSHPHLLPRGASQ